MFLARMAEKLYQEYLQVIDQIIENLLPNVRRKTVRIKEILDINISLSNIVRFHKYLNLIKHRDDETKALKR